MSPEFQAFASGFPVAGLHAAASLGLWVVGVGLYRALFLVRRSVAVEPVPVAEATLMGSALLCLAMPLAVSLAASASLIEIGLWGGVLILSQLLGFRLVDLGFSAAAAAARGGDVAAAALIAAARLGVALIVSAAVAG